MANKHKTMSVRSSGRRRQCNPWTVKIGIRLVLKILGELSPIGSRKGCTGGYTSRINVRNCKMVSASHTLPPYLSSNTLYPCQCHCLGNRWKIVQIGTINWFYWSSKTIWEITCNWMNDRFELSQNSEFNYGMANVRKLYVVHTHTELAISGVVVIVASVVVGVVVTQQDRSTDRPN